MVVIVRAANLEDYRELIRLLGRYVGDDSTYLALDSDSFKQILTSSNSFMDVAVKDEKLVGFVNYSVRNVLKFPKPIVEIEDLYVIDEYRRKGVGRRLMEAVIEFAKERGIKYIYIPVDNSFSNAERFVKALNFHRYGSHYRRAL